MKSGIENILAENDIAATPVRVLVFKTLRESVTPLSMADLETILDSVDKSSISRTLSLFRDHHLVHAFSDGSGSMKYEVCHSHGVGEDKDTHVHFRCEGCGTTICLPEVRIPEVVLPEGYLPMESNYIIKGYCPDCARHR